MRETPYFTEDMYEMVDQHNKIVELMDEETQKQCKLSYTDSYPVAKKKCSSAYNKGAYFLPLITKVLIPSEHDNDPDLDDKPPMSTLQPAERDDDGGSFMAEADEKSSTPRVRKYYKKHPEKVKKYLRKTVKDRAKRNHDRAAAVEKHGEKKMANHDVHHPDGPDGGHWKLAKKDHGPDKKDDKEKKKALPTPKKATSAPKKKPSAPSTPKKKPAAPEKQDTNTEILRNFIDFVAKKLKLKEIPKINAVPASPETHDQPSLGAYNPETKEIDVCFDNRLMADILRTIAHEMVHKKQEEIGVPISGETGSPSENQANSVAGILMRQYGKINKKIFTKPVKEQSVVVNPRTQKPVMLITALSYPKSHPVYQAALKIASQTK